MVGVHSPRYREMRSAHRYHGEVIVEVTGAPPLRMLNHDDDMVAYVYFFFGPDAYESLSVHLFARFAAEAGRALVLDIGAFTGLFGLVAAAANPAARVTCFEPAPHIADRARLNRDLNGLGNLEIETSAVSDVRGARTLIMYGGDAATSGASLAAKPARRRGAATVEAVRLDDRLAGRARPVALVKLDTEGDETAAMKGAAGLLASDGPLVISEALTDDALGAQRAAMAAHGYRAWMIDERRRRLERIGPGFTLEGRGFGNVLFARGDKQRDRAKAVARSFRAARRARLREER